MGLDELMQAEIACLRDRLAAAANAQFLQDVVYVPLGCAQADHQLIGDLLVGLAGREQAEDAQFLFAERLLSLIHI